MQSQHIRNKASFFHIGKTKYVKKIYPPLHFSIDIIVPLDIDINSEWVLKKMLSIFNKYHYNAKIDNNDILIDNKKVLGSASIATDNMFAFISHISFTDRSEYIQNICGVNTDKQPGFITPPLTREILINEVKLWLMAQ